MKEDKLAKEYERLEAMTTYERGYAKRGYIAGIDEAGRGPLAGPVVAAAVILPQDEKFLYLNDSKKVTPKRREVLFDQIKEKAIAYSIAIVDAETIDEINILQATYKAMQEAISNLCIKPDILLNDAVTIPDVDIEQVAIIKGDAKSVSIAAASILAKVTRDRYMLDLDKEFPQYSFASHKGYGTKAHTEALLKYGPMKEHRRTFIKKYI